MNLKQLVSNKGSHDPLTLTGEILNPFGKNYTFHVGLAWGPYCHAISGEMSFLFGGQGIKCSEDPDWRCWLLRAPIRTRPGPACRLSGVWGGLVRCVEAYL